MTDPYRSQPAPSSAPLLGETPLNFAVRRYMAESMGMTTPHQDGDVHAIDEIDLLCLGLVRKEEKA